jgi:hypothetical protein
MSEAIRSRRSRRFPWDMLLPLLLPSAVVGGILWAVFTWLPPGPQFVAEARECDKQVAILLTTHDAVDLERAKFIVRWLNCSLDDRLPPS